MRQRAITIIFAHKFLIILPLLVTLPVTSVLGLRPQPPQWQSQAIAWVDQPLPNWQTIDLGWTPSGNQVNFLNALVKTDNFTQNAIQQTPMAADMSNPVTAQAAKKYFWQSVSITSMDLNLMAITVTMRDPNLAYKTAQAVLNGYQGVLSNRGKTVSDQALSAAGASLKQTEQTLVDAHTQLANYISSHPNLINPTGTQNTFSTVTDVNLALLQQQVSDAQSNYSNARQYYLNVQGSATTGQQTEDSSFQIIQQPELPTQPVHQSLLARLELPVIGLVLGILLGACTAAALILTDRSVLTPYDVLRGLNLTVLGEVPEISPARNADLGDNVRQQLAASAR